MLLLPSSPKKAESEEYLVQSAEIKNENAIKHLLIKWVMESPLNEILFFFFLFLEMTSLLYSPALPPCLIAHNIGATFFSSQALIKYKGISSSASNCSTIKTLPFTPTKSFMEGHT